MKECNPKLGHWICDCPVQDGEFNCCQITQSKCPKTTELDDGDYSMAFPDDCPAKAGMIIKIK